MSDSIPEYYESLAGTSAETVPEQEDREGNSPERGEPLQSGEEAEARRYRGDAFSFRLPEGQWRDQTVYILAGPVFDGLAHTITITGTDLRGERDPAEVAREGRRAVLAELDGGRILHADEVELGCGHPAQRVIVVWFPEEGRRYLEQLYVCYGNRKYVVSASFTRASRRRIGVFVERIMLSFTPGAEKGKG